MNAFVIREVRLPKPGARINIPGSFWTGTPAAERAKLFAVTVVEVSEDHQFNARVHGPGARLQLMKDLDSDEVSSEDVPNLWIQAKVYSEFERTHKVSP